MNRHQPYRPFTTCPHTYGVRPWSCPAIATEPCRPTAWVRERPCPHNGQGGRGKRYPTGLLPLTGQAMSALAQLFTVHCSLFTVHWTFTFSVKERDSETGLSYFGSRYYSSDLSVWLSVDPMAAKYPSLSPYVYCANNPVMLVDPDGEAWYENENGEIKWTDHKSQEQMDENHINGRYLGETVVLFEGSTNEKLGKGGCLDGEGALTAKVTVYGKSGSDDIDSYIGFTMSSDYEKYGAIADGYYNVEYDKKGKSGAIPSHYVEGRDPVDCLYGVNYASRVLPLQGCSRRGAQNTT